TAYRPPNLHAPIGSPCIYTVRNPPRPKKMFPMRTPIPITVGLILVMAMQAICYGQAPPKTKGAPEASSLAVQAAVDLAAKGRCTEALPALKQTLARSPGRSSGKELEYRAAMATAKCAMSLNQSQTAINALFILKRHFPHDPEVLYITTHYFSELAMQAS